MALEDAITKKTIETQPHADEFNRLRARLDPNEREAIERELFARLDAVAVGKTISASWVPGANWSGTVFEPIYMKVCNRDFDASALFFGKFFKQVVIEHDSLWRSVKQPKSKNDPNGVEITLYWRAD